VFNKLTYLLTYLIIYLHFNTPNIKVTSRLRVQPAAKILATTPMTTDMYEVPDAVPHIHAVSHVATDKDPTK